MTILRQRGLLQEVTSDELEKTSADEQLSVYCGFDPTADSLHLGNLLGIIVLSWFQRWFLFLLALFGMPDAIALSCFLSVKCLLITPSYNI